jgi:TolC family type I secretion outer membrane protein
LLGLAAILAMGAAFGQAPPALPDRPLSLQECVRFAVEKNPSIASALHSGRSTLARVGTSKSAYYPTADFGASLSRSYLEPQNRSGGSFSGGSSTSTSTGASLSAQYTLWDSGLRSASLGGARANYQASDARFLGAAQDLAMGVETAYFAIQGAQWALQVSQDTLKQADFHLDMAAARNEVGLAPRSDVLKAATAQADARLSVILAESTLVAAQSNLATLMGLPADAPLQIDAAQRDAPLPILPDWASGWERAKGALPELRAARETTESFRYAYLGAKASYMPTVSADGGLGLTDGGNWPNRRQWSVGVSLRIPVFTGFARKFQILQAKESLEGSRADLQSAFLWAESAAYSARIALNRAIQSVEAAKAYVASAQENSDVAEGRYQNGLGAMLDVVDATTELSSAKLRLISARFTVATAQVAWERATGVDLLEGVDLPSTQAHSPDGDSKP